MTRKDYILIAAALADVRASYSSDWDANLFRACTDHAKELARMLTRTHPCFDRERFLRACDVPEAQIK